MEILEINNRLTEIFRKTFNDPSINITPETVADDIPAWDSLTNMDLIFSIEEAFDIRLTTREVRKMQNVGNLAELIQTKVI